MASSPELIGCTSCKAWRKVFHGTIVLAGEEGKNPQVWKELRNIIMQCHSVTLYIWYIQMCTHRHPQLEKESKTNPTELREKITHAKHEGETSRASPASKSKPAIFQFTTLQKVKCWNCKPSSDLSFPHPINTCAANSSHWKTASTALAVIIRSISSFSSRHRKS